MAGHARRPRHHRAGRPVQHADARAAAVRPGRCLRRTATSRCWCSTSPTRWCRSRSPSSALGKRARAGGGRRPARVHRAGDRHPAAPRATSRRRCTARTCCRCGGEYTVEVMAAGLAPFAAALLPRRRTPHRRSAWLARQPRAPRRRWRSAAGRSRCRRARRASASAARSGRCSRRSSWRSRTSGRCTSRPTSAATPSAPSSRSPSATPSSATA